MAGSKETTRQKMINLMYLVFIAMLALNISKEVLGTLGILNEDIQLSNTELQKQITLGYAKIDEGNKQAGDRYTAAFEEKENLQSVTNAFYTYLQDIIDMLQKDENGNLDEGLRKTIEVDGEIITRWDYQLMTKGKELQDYFFLKPTITETNDGVKLDVNENGAKFIELYSSFEANINKVLDSMNSKNERNAVKPFEFNPIKDDLKNRFPFSDDGTVIDRDGDKKPYLRYHFDGFPLIASISKFTNMQANILSIENRILKAITEGIAVDDMQLDNYETNLYSENSFITGKSIDAKIVLGRNDDNFKPNKADLFVDGKKLIEDTDYTIENGGVFLKKAFPIAKIYKLSGTLFFNETDSVEVDQQINVQKDAESAIVSLEAMQIMYRGLSNPISVGFPGVPESSISISVSNGKEYPKGNLKYDIDPTGEIGEFVNVTVRGSIDGVTKIDNTNSYEIKKAPPGKASVRVEFGGNVSNFCDFKDPAFPCSEYISKEALRRGVITGLKPTWFDYEYEIRVDKFSMKIGEGQPIEITGRSVGTNTNLLGRINSASSGTRIDIEVLDAVKIDTGRESPQEDMEKLTLYVR